MASQTLDNTEIEELIRKGYPVFGPEWIARVKAEMHAIHPLVPTPKPTISSDHTYSKLRKMFKCSRWVVKMKPAKLEPWTRPEEPDKKYAKNLSAELAKLIDEKFIKPATCQNSKARRFEITHHGRTFMADYEREQKAKKKG